MVGEEFSPNHITIDRNQIISGANQFAMHTFLISFHLYTKKSLHQADNYSVRTGRKRRMRRRHFPQLWGNSQLIKINTRPRMKSNLGSVGGFR